MERPSSGTKQVLLLVSILALLYGSVVVEAQQNSLKKCVFRAALCIAKCLQRCLVVPKSAQIHGGIGKGKDGNNPTTCILQCVESSCTEYPPPPPQEGEEPEPPPEGDEPEAAPDFGKVGDLVDSCSNGDNSC